MVVASDNRPQGLRDRGRICIVAPDHALLHAATLEILVAEMMTGVADLDAARVIELFAINTMPDGEIDQLGQGRDQRQRLVVLDTPTVARDHEAVVRGEKTVEKRPTLVGSRIDIPDKLLPADEVFSLRLRSADGAVVIPNHAHQLEGHATQGHHRRGGDRTGPERLPPRRLLEPRREHLPDVVEGDGGRFSGGARGSLAQLPQLGERVGELPARVTTEANQGRLDRVAPVRHGSASSRDRLELADHVDDSHQGGDRRDIGGIESGKRHDPTEFGPGEGIRERRA